jgi:hypothetical protein
MDVLTHLAGEAAMAKARSVNWNKLSESTPDRRLEFRVEAEKNDEYARECEEAIAILIRERSNA